MHIFFFNDTATTEISTLSLHDALPILPAVGQFFLDRFPQGRKNISVTGSFGKECRRSEEHTSELQSHLNLVCRLLLEKKKQQRARARTVQRNHTPEQTYG